MRQVSVVKVLVVGTMVATTMLLINVAVSLASDVSGVLRWLAVPLSGTLAAVLSALDQWRHERSEPETTLPQLAPPANARPARVATSGVRGMLRRLTQRLARPTLTTAVIVAVITLGGGGTVVAGIARYGMDWVTGNEHGPNRLLHPATSTTDGVTVTVSRIEQTAHFTRISVAIDNETDQSISLPLGEGNAELIAGDGTIRRAQAFRSQWSETITSGGTTHGVITVMGHLPGDSTRARLTFVHVFGYGSEIPTELTVQGIQLRLLGGS